MTRFAFLVAAALLAPACAIASSHRHAPPNATAPAPAALSEGEVRKVDKEAGKVTIKHGPLVNLEMPAMTMVFRVRDREMLDKVRAGDSIRFRAENVDGGFTIVEYRLAGR